MVHYVLDTFPRINKRMLLHSGATEIRRFFPAHKEIVIEGYMEGLQVVFLMAAGAAGVATLISLLTRWKKLKQQEGVTVVVA
jgi:ATP-dependent RNA circularization protein (DNA/RNA ligase family)